MDELSALSGRAHRALEALHSMIYFVPEAEQRYVAIGLRPGRMGYFASRSAPMGAVGPGVTAATFYNFNPELVARFIPRAWTLATPEAILTARLEAVDAALTRLLGDAVTGPEVAEAAELALEACGPLGVAGRPLYAGHADLPWPDQPHLVLWHAVTLLREHRGDGHIASLIGHELDGIEAILTHTATGRGFLVEPAKLLRGWSDEQWATAEDGLRKRGLLDDEGTLTEAGIAQRAAVEADTDEWSIAAWAHLGVERTQRLVELGRGLSRTVLKAGAFPPGVFATGQ